MYRIFIVEDDAGIARGVEQLISSWGCTCAAGSAPIWATPSPPNPRPAWAR